MPAVAEKAAEAERVDWAVDWAERVDWAQRVGWTGMVQPRVEE